MRATDRVSGVHHHQGTVPTLPERDDGGLVHSKKVHGDDDSSPHAES